MVDSAGEAGVVPGVERHPFEPFLPDGARVLFLGSFPPQPKRWSMPFYYPNWINDYWRILGVIFFGDKDHFCIPSEKRFDLESIKAFCSAKGIALFDTATAVRRLRDNASDKFLEIVEPTDVMALLRRISSCEAVVTTGEKATQTLCEAFGVAAPALGEYSVFRSGRPEGGSGGLADGGSGAGTLRLYRMPSTSRAYPLALMRKADAYRRLFSDLGMIGIPEK